MQKTPKALRLHIGIFGRRNVGKSSVLNALIKQKVSIVSDVAGTTTDPVEKVMELQPAGPVVFIDTAGIDDVGALGQMRVAQTKKVIERTELAIIVTDDFQEYERELVALFQERSTPTIVVANKCDLRCDNSLELQAKSFGAKKVVTTNASTAEGINDLRSAIIDLAKDGPLAQVQTLREVLDENACAIVVKEDRVAEMIAALKEPPDLVITDSQAFEDMKKIVPVEIPLTSFSILYARYKGDLAELVKGAMAIDKIVPGDSILIAEACTHHPIGEDIGRVKIPKWLKEYVGGELHFDTVAGRDFPDDLGDSL